MRILHTSDWHLGRIFHGHLLTEDQAFLLEQIESFIEDFKPDVILNCGDIFDRSMPPKEAVELLDEHLSKIISTYKVPYILIAGNHDSPERLSFLSKIVQKSSLFISGKAEKENMPVILSDKDGEVCFYPLPYTEIETARLLYKDTKIKTHEELIKKQTSSIMAGHPPQKRSVLVAHIFVRGSQNCESERPLSIGGSEMVSSSVFEAFNYTALGHLHKNQKAEKNSIRYSGSLMKYSLSEAEHEKSVNLIELKKDGTISAEERKLFPKRDLRKIRGNLDDILKNHEKSEDYLSFELLDESVLYEPMRRLREKYPNAISIERINKPENSSQSAMPDVRKSTELEIYTALKQYKENGKKPSRKELLYFQNILNEIRAS